MALVDSREVQEQDRAGVRGRADSNGEGVETPVDGGRPNRGPVMLAERVRDVRNGKSDCGPRMRCGLVSRGRKADF